MEIDEIKGYWKEESKRISEKVEVNKEVSFQKLHYSFDKIRIHRLYRLILMCIAVPLIFVLIVFPRMKNDDSILFYVALASFIIPIAFFFFYYIYYYICLLKIDFTESVLKAQREIYRLETFDKRLNWLGLIIVPIVTLSTFKIFGIPFKQEAAIMIAMITATMVISFIFKLKVQIPKEYSKVKSYLDEMEKRDLPS